MEKVFKSFEAVGKIGLNRDVVKLQTSSKNASWKKKEISMMVDEGNGNKPYAVAVGQFNDFINLNFKKEGATENTKMKVPYSEIANESLLKQVPDYKKQKIDITHSLNLKLTSIAKVGEAKFTIEPNKYAKFLKVINGINVKSFDEVFNEFELETPIVNEFDTINEVINIKFETLSDWDFVEFIERNSEAFAGKRLKLSGDVEISEYNGRTFDKYIIKRILDAKDDESNKFEAVYGIFFTEGALNKDKLKTEGIVNLEGYVDYYNSKVEGNYSYAKVDFKFDFSKVIELVKDEKTPKETKEKLTKRMEFMIKQFEQSYKDGLTETLKNGKVYYCDWKVRVVRGTEEKEITMEDLSDNQKGLIEYGIKTFEEIKSEMRGSLKGDKISELRLVAPNGKNVYGAEDAGIESEVLTTNTPKPQQSTKKVEETKVDEVKIKTDDVDALFAGL